MVSSHRCCSKNTYKHFSSSSIGIHQLQRRKSDSDTPNPPPEPDDNHNRVSKPNPISNIRHVILSKKNTNPQLQSAYDQLHRHQHTFWETNNRRYLKEKDEMIREETEKCVTRGEMDEKISIFEVGYQERYADELKHFEMENRRLVWRVWVESVKSWSVRQKFLSAFGTLGVGVMVMYCL